MTCLCNSVIHEVWKSPHKRDKAHTKCDPSGELIKEDHTIVMPSIIGQLQSRHLSSARHYDRHNPISTVCGAVRSSKRLKYGPQIGQRSGREPKVIEITPGAGEEWKVAQAVEILQNGGVSAQHSSLSKLFDGL